jgi:hypothetical protein
MKENRTLDVSVVPLKSPGDRLRVLFISHAYVVGVNQGKLNVIDWTTNEICRLIT